MKRKLTAGLSVAAAVVAFAAVPSGASAAHCVAPAGEEPAPGFSYFGTDHVQETDHKEGGNPGPHMGTPGASNCNDPKNPSPSTRAPGRQKS